MKELKFKKCMICGTIVEVLEGNGNLICCGKSMIELIPNSVEASFEKHIPTYEVENNQMRVEVNHVMEENHYIEWILVQTPNQIYKKEFNPGDTPVMEAPYEKGSVIYAYCNLHGLWKKDVE